jgi:hypothetical protein
MDEDFGALMVELAEINQAFENGSALAQRTMIDTEGDGGWQDKIQKWFERFREFAKNNGFKGFSIEAEAGLPPKISVTLDFEF